MNFGGFVQSGDPALDHGEAVARLDWDGLSNVSEIPTKTSRVLIISSSFKLPYRVLRCAHDDGLEIFSLGTRKARGLRYSRYCKQFVQTDLVIDGRYDADLAREINDNVYRFGIDCVLAGDAPSTRSLIAVRDLIKAPCFPMPTLDEFDFLDDKWKFGKLCEALDVLRPATRLFANKQELIAALDRKELSFPQFAKPLRMEAGIGCVKLESDNVQVQLAGIFYEPILVQSFIEGEDIGASVFVDHGKIIGYVSHKYRRDTYTTFDNQSIYDNISKIVRSRNVSGVFNFDMRLTRDQRIFYLECNPRFFFKMAMSMIAGVNFVSMGLRRREAGSPLKTCAPSIVRFPKALAVALLTLRKLDAKSWSALRYVLSDPIPYLREELGIEKGAHRA